MFLASGWIHTVHTNTPFNNTPLPDPHLAPRELESLLDHLLDCTLELVLCNARTDDGDDAAGAALTTTKSSSILHPAAAASFPATRCYCWRLQQRHDFRGGGQARLTLSQHVDSPCARPPTFLSFLLADLNAFNPLVAALAALYLALLAKALAASVGVFLRARRSFALHAAGGTRHPLTERWVPVGLVFINVRG